MWRGKHSRRMHNAKCYVSDKRSIGCCHCEMMNPPIKRNKWVSWPLKKCVHHDDVIKWKHFLRYWAFVRGIHWSPVNSPHKGQWRGALVLYLICAWTNGWANHRDAGDLRRHRVHYDVTAMWFSRHMCQRNIVVTFVSVWSPNRWQANIWTNVGKDLRHHMASQGHNEYTSYRLHLWVIS